MAISAQKFLPQAKTISGTKLLGSGKSSSALIKKSNISTKNFIKSGAIVKSEVSSIKVFDSTIEKFNKIESILKENNKILSTKKDTERVEDEKKKRKEKEEKLEEQKEQNKMKIPGLNLPGAGIIDRVKRFLLFTALGWLFDKFNKYLPQLSIVGKIVGNVYGFFEKFTGNFLNGLIDFVGFGYKVYDDSRNLVEKIGGKDAAKTFDEFSGHLNKLIQGAIAVSLLIASTAPKTPKTPAGTGGAGASYAAGYAAGLAAGRGGRPGAGFRDPSRYRTPGQARSGGFDLEQARKSLPSKPTGPRGPLGTISRAFKGAGAQLETGTLFKRGAGFQRALYNTPGKLKGVASKLGGLGKFGGKIFGRIPIIGGLIDFAISLALGEDPGRAAAKAVGSTAGAALGTLIPIPGVGTILGGVLGDIAGGALYDTLIANKKKPKGHSKGGPIGTKKPQRGLKQSFKKKRPPKALPRKSQPGKDVGGDRKIRKLYKDPTYKMSMDEFLRDPMGQGSYNYQQYLKDWEKDKAKRFNSPNPYKALTKTAEYLKEIPLLGSLMGASVDIALGQKPTKDVYSNLSKSFSYLVQSFADIQVQKSISLLSKEISLLASGGTIEPGRGISSGSQEKLSENLNNIFTQIIQPKLELAVSNIKKEVDKKMVKSGPPQPGGGGGGGGEYGKPPRLGPGGPITTVPGIVDQQGRPVRFAKPAADAFIVMMEAAKKEKKPFKGSDIASTYRDPELNRKVGGAENSPHLHGLAADIHGTTGAWIRSKGKDYGWVPYDYEGTHGGHYEYVGGGKKEKPTKTLPDIFKPEPKKQPGQLPEIFQLPGQQPPGQQPGQVVKSGTSEASWYGPGFYGNRTASGKLFTESSFLVAHKSLPFGTMVRFTYNGKTITVPVEDRGPFKGNREWDLSSKAADQLGIKAAGVANVKYEILRKQGGGYVTSPNGQRIREFITPGTKDKMPTIYDTMPTPIEIRKRNFFRKGSIASYPSYSDGGEMMLAIQPVIIQQPAPSMNGPKTYFPSSGLVNSVGANSRSNLVRG